MNGIKGVIMDAEQLLLDNGYEGVVYFSDFSYDDALIGVSHDNRAIYDYEKMVEWLIKNQNWSAEDAMEWIDYNTIRSIPYVGTSAPIVMYPLERFEDDK